MVLSPAVASIFTILHAAVALSIVLLYPMAIVNDIAIAMTVPLAKHIALVDDTTVVIVHPYQAKN